MTKNISFGYIRLLSLFGLTIECDLYRLYYFVNTLLELKRSVEYIVAEVMICRGGFGSGSGRIGGKNILKVDYIYETKDLVVPEAINNEFDVRIFGRGGGGYVKSTRGANGGGGYYAPSYGEGGASFGNIGNSNDIRTIDGIHGGGGSVYNDGYFATSGAAAGNGGNSICIIRYYVKE